MLDIIVRMRMSETKPVYGSVSAPSGQTVTINSATWSLYASSGALVGTANQAVTGNDSGALATARAWVSVSPSALSLTPDLYSLVIVMSVTGSDGISRVEEANVGLLVTADGA